MEEINENLDSQNKELEEQPIEKNEVEETTEEETNKPAEETTNTSFEEKIEELELKNKQLFARLKKQEVKPQSKKSNKEQPLSRDEAIFFARGGTDEELVQLHKIMKAEKISLTEAQEDTMFKAWKSSAEYKDKSDKAQLNPSTGSPVKKAKPVGRMTEGEHRDHFNKVVGNDKRSPVMPTR